MSKPSVHVVIVSWNSGALLLDCLRSFAGVKHDAIDVTIAVVDNASSDGCLEPIASLAIAPPLRIVRNAENRGFAAACNQGAAGATTEFLLFLNPDTRLSAGSLERPATFLREPGNQTVGIAGIQLLDSSGAVARSCARLPTAAAMIGQSLGLDRLMPSLFPSNFMLEWDHATTRDVGQVIGAFFFIRRNVYEELGGFDERFFVYFEDLDLAIRARQRGWSSRYIADTQAFHHGGASSASAVSDRLFYNSRSRILFAFKHFNRFEAAAVAAATLFGEPVARIVAAMATGRGGTIWQVLRGFSMLWADLPNVVRVHLQSTPARCAYSRVV